MHNAFWFVIVLSGLAGCATTNENRPLQEEASATLSTDATIHEINQVGYEAPISQQETGSGSGSSDSGNQEEIIAPKPRMAMETLTLDVLEKMALQNNPSIAQADAQLEALEGKWVQVGLPPNPSAGYMASEVGDDGTAGQQGGYVGQTFIRGHKLTLNQNVVRAEINKAQQQLATVQTQVRTDIRKSFYKVLIAQRRVELTENLLRLSTEAADASKALLKADVIPRAGLLQTEVQQSTFRVLLRTANNKLEESWRELTAILNRPDLEIIPLVGDIHEIPQLLNWQEELTRVQNDSPEMAKAYAEVERTQRALERAWVEAVPDLNTQFSVQYSNSTGDTLTGIQLGMPIPLWNRNQGGIHEAQAEMTRAHQSIERLNQNLKQRLARTFREYSDAHATAITYATDILPRSKETFELVQRGYNQGELGYLDLLTAQQTYAQTNLVYLDALELLWNSYIRIDGLLLDDSLASIEE